MLRVVSCILNYNFILGQILFKIYVHWCIYWAYLNQQITAILLKTTCRVHDLYRNNHDFRPKLTGGCFRTRLNEEENGRRMSLPVIALACELNKNLKTFGSSLDVLLASKAAWSTSSRSRCVPLVQGMLEYARDRVFTCRRRSFRVRRSHVWP